MIKTYNLNKLNIPQRHGLLLGAIGPRPIAFASTIDKNGNKNIAPFSFFNLFSSNPPILVFSPAISGRTKQPKDTLLNVKEVAEVVINIVNYDIVHQMSLASSPYEKGVSEFEKMGLTPIKSDVVKPYRLKESPIQLECKVNEVISLGNEGAAGNMVICEILVMHVNEDVLESEYKIDQQKIDLMARMGGNWYCRAHGSALFEIEKPITTCGIGVDALPQIIRNSKVLTGNDLGRLGNIEKFPTKADIALVKESFNNITDKELAAKKLISIDMVQAALSLLLS